MDPWKNPDNEIFSLKFRLKYWFKTLITAAQDKSKWKVSTITGKNKLYYPANSIRHNNNDKV
jgi:hypothetical protein